MLSTRVTSYTPSPYESTDWKFFSRVDEQFALLFTQAMSYLIRIRGNSRRKIHRRMSNPPSKLLSHKHDPYAMNENDRKQHGEHRSFSEMIHGGKSVYRGNFFFSFELAGAYSTEADAAKAHDLVSVKIGGLKALTNFPGSNRPVLAHGIWSYTATVPDEVNTSFEPYNFQDNTLNQIPHENLNFILSDSFQNPSSEPNNNGSQGETSGCQIDLDMRDYLNRSYIEENDFACDFGMFGAMNGDRQGL
ncbi:hypothetical protein JHK87_007288 [Glycine soja]|nr:hypothetical protein JHK87_007288 [Glycine soja]